VELGKLQRPLRRSEEFSAAQQGPRRWAASCVTRNATRNATRKAVIARASASEIARLSEIARPSASENRAECET
jgi:hypothetical protein